MELLDYRLEKWSNCFEELFEYTLESVDTHQYDID